MQALKSPKFRIAAALCALVLVILGVAAWRIKVASARAPRAAKKEPPELPASQRINRGLAALEARSLDEAVTEFSAAIKRDATVASFYIDRALAYDLKRDYDKAIQDCDQAIKLDPKNGEALYVRGLCRAGKKRYPEALADFDAALGLDWKNVECYLRRGDVFLQQKQLDKALEDYNEAARLDPERAEAFVSRGDVLAKKKQYENAVADYTHALRLDSEDPQNYRNLAWIYATCPKAELRNGKQAFDYALYACKLTKWKDPQCLDTLGAACAEIGLYAEAIKWAKRALESPELVASAERAKQVRARLKGYEAAKPYRDQ
jgi:serine/threonine-protein kinase